MIEVLSINHISVLVSDTVRALDFYQGVLGLELDPGRPELAVSGAWLRVGNQALHLIETAADIRQLLHAHCGRDRHLALNVANLDVVVVMLDAGGLDYTLSRSGRRALFCRDPDGNAVELVES